MLRPTLVVAVVLAASITAYIPTPASDDRDDDTHITVEFPKSSPGHKAGGEAEVNICPFNSFDELRSHYATTDDPDVKAKIRKAFEQAIRTDGLSKDDAFDHRHTGCDDNEDTSSTQTKEIPSGSVDAGDGTTE